MRGFRVAVILAALFTVPVFDIARALRRRRFCVHVRQIRMRTRLFRDNRICKRDFLCRLSVAVILATVSTVPVFDIALGVIGGRLCAGVLQVGMIIRCNACFFAHDFSALIAGTKNLPFFGAGSISLNDIKFRIIIVSFVIAGFKGDIQVLCNIRNRKDNRFSVSIKGISEICPQFQTDSVITCNEQFLIGKSPLLRANIIFFTGKVKVNAEILTLFQLVGRILQRSKPCSIYKVYKAKCGFLFKGSIKCLVFRYRSQRRKRIR